MCKFSVVGVNDKEVFVLIHLDLVNKVQVVLTHRRFIEFVQVNAEKYFNECVFDKKIYNEYDQCLFFYEYGYENGETYVFNEKKVIS